MIKRLTLSTLGGAVVTTILGLGMMSMIAAEFTVEEKPPTLDFEIMTQVEDLPILSRTQELKELRKIETPPAPPPIDRQEATLPSEVHRTVGGGVPNFVMPDIDQEIFTISVDNKNASPILRVAGQMPSRAEKSGHCRMRFSVSPEGQPYDVEAYSCSESLFKRESVKAASKFKYSPKMVNGRAVAMTGVETVIRYRLTDANGQLIPE